MTTTALDSIPITVSHGTSPSQKRVLLLKPRGFCAGVVRAIDIVKIALETFGAPIYVRREIVHNRYVVNELAEKGAIFVHEIDDVPDGQRVIYSAHGVSPAVRERSKGRNLKVIDATCPLVTKVHIEAVKFAKQGYSLVLIGHRDHDEIEGTLGEAPDVTQVVSNVAEVESARGSRPQPRGLSHPDHALARRGARHHPRPQAQVSQHRRPPLAGHLLRHRESPGGRAQRGPQCRVWSWSWVPPTAPTPTAWLRFRATWAPSGISLITPRPSIPHWLEGVETVAVTAGASAPEVLVEDVVNYLRQNGFSNVEEVEVMPENVRFGLPPEIVQAIGSASGASPSPFVRVCRLAHESAPAHCASSIQGSFAFEG